ncbi:MAG: SurA N-terminal domain-containing protein [Chloroflexia bacterium]
MSFDKQRGYDEEEYNADEVAVPPRVRRERKVSAPMPTAEEWEDEGEGEPEAMPVRPTRATAPPRPVKPQARPMPRSGRGAVRVAGTRQVGGRTGLPGWALPAGVAVVALLLVIGFYLASNVQNPLSPPPADAAATVNGKVITKTYWQDRLTIAKQSYVDQFGLNFDNSDSGKRMADVLGFDVLDQMIDFEIMLQQAKKESVVPNPTQVAANYQQARDAAAKQNMTWDQFLASQGAKDDNAFRQNIQDTYTYLALAGNHARQDGTDQEKANSLADYICGLRPNYDVKIYVQFIVQQSPCESARNVPGEPAAGITVPAGNTPPPQPVETGGPTKIQPTVGAPVIPPTPNK